MVGQQNLYFMLNQFTGLIKIGVSVNVVMRRRELEHACGVDLSVLAVMEHGECYEIPLHLALHADRQRGEWFLPSDDLLALIDNTETIPDYIEDARPRIQARLDAIAGEKRSANEARRVELLAERQAVKDARQALKRKKAEAGARREERRTKREAEQAIQHQARLNEFHSRQSEWLARKGLRLADAGAITTERLAKIAHRRKRNLDMLG